MSASCCNPCKSINDVNKSVTAINNAIQVLIRQQQDTINIINNGGGSTPSGPIPDDLFLHVSTLGNDVTGTGTLAAPYLTIDRAVRDVFTLGWNNSAEIRILSSGGTFQLPINTNFETGGRGLQKSPLIIRGFNTNPVPGRTIVFTQTVVSASSDTRSQSITITGPGPYTSAQVGQYIRFTSGVYASIPAVNGIPGFIGFSELNVPIVDIINPTTFRIAFSSSTIPNAGDSFVIESIDTIINIQTFSAIRGFDRIVLEDLILTSPTAGLPSVSGLALQGGNFLQFRGVNIQSQGFFVIVGFDSTVIAAGDVFNNMNNFGLAASTKSLFVNVAPTGSFALRPNDGSQYSSVSLKYAAIIGSKNIDFTGSISCSYIGQSQVQVSNGKAFIDNVFIKDSSVSIGREGDLVMAGVYLLDTNIFTSGASRLTYSGLTIENASISFNGAFVNGSDTTLLGTGSLSGVISLFNSQFIHNGSLLLPSNNISDGLLINSGSQMYVSGDLVASNFTGVGRSGIIVSDSSLLYVQGLITSDNNSGSGILLNRESSLVCSGSVSVQNNQTGLSLLNSRATINSQTIASGNSFLGLSISSDSHVSSFSINALNNGSTNINVVSGSSIKTDNITANGIASAGAVIVSNDSSLLARVISVDNTSGASLLIDMNSSATIVETGTFTNSTPLFTGGVSATRGSRLIVGNQLTSTNHTGTGSGCVISDLSSIYALSVNVNSNQASGLIISQGSFGRIDSISASNNIADGVLVEKNSNLTIMSFLDAASNIQNGLSVIDNSSVFATQLLSSSGNNNFFGARAIQASKIKTTALTSILGTAGDAKVGVNAATTWANIFTQNPAFTADYLSGQNPTELCQITV